MIIFILVAIFILGTIIGSFLNVVIYRYNSGETVGGRSKCLICSKPLSAFELVPVFSYLLLLGRCKGCSSKISIQYPLVEIFTGLSFLAIFLHLQKTFLLADINFILHFIILAAIFSILIVIFVYDLKHKIIPDGLVYAFTIISLVFLFIQNSPSYLFQMPGILDLLAGPIFFIPFFLLWYLSKGTWIGLGDGKLVVGIGWFLGIIGGLSALVISFWIGAIVGILILLISRLKQRSRNITMKTEIPFAPFLIIGTILEFFYQFDVMGLSLFI